MSDIQEIISYIESLYEEMDIPKKIGSKLNLIKDILNNDSEISIKKSQCLSELDDLHENHQIDANLRCQLWDIVTCLEQL